METRDSGIVTNNSGLFECSRSKQDLPNDGRGSAQTSKMDTSTDVLVSDIKTEKGENLATNVDPVEKSIQITNVTSFNDCPFDESRAVECPNDLQSMKSMYSEFTTEQPINQLPNVTNLPKSTDPPIEDAEIATNNEIQNVHGNGDNEHNILIPNRDTSSLIDHDKSHQITEKQIGESDYFGSEASVFSLSGSGEEPDQLLNVKGESVELLNNDEIINEFAEVGLSEIHLQQFASCNVAVTQLGDVVTESQPVPVALKKASEIQKESEPPSKNVPKGKVTTLLDLSSIRELQKLWTKKDKSTKNVVGKGKKLKSSIPAVNNAKTKLKSSDLPVEKTGVPATTATSPWSKKGTGLPIMKLKTSPKSTSSSPKKKSKLNSNVSKESTMTMADCSGTGNSKDTQNRIDRGSPIMSTKSLLTATSVSRSKGSAVKSSFKATEINTMSAIYKPAPKSLQKKKISTLETCMANKVTQFKLKHCTRPCKVKLHKIENIYKSFGKLKIDLYPLDIGRKSVSKKKLKRVKQSYTPRKPAKGNKYGNNEEFETEDEEEFIPDDRSDSDLIASDDDNDKDFDPQNEIDKPSQTGHRTSRKRKITNYDESFDGSKQIDVKIDEIDLNEEAYLDYEVHVPVKKKYKKRSRSGKSGVSKVEPDEFECKDFKCRLCGFVSDDKNQYQDHHAKYHPVLKCEFCDAKFKSNNCFLMHLAKKHTGIKYFKCHVEGCDYASKDTTDLKRHQSKHATEKSHICSLCGWQTKWARNLRSHHLMKHQDVRNFKCNICPYTCKRSSDLKQHKYRHTEDKPITCLECGFKVKTNWELRSHMLTHTTEKPFKCSFPGCSAATKTNADLTKHMRTHKTERDFICKICQRGYKDQQSLNKHIGHMHTEGRKFDCDNCGRQMKSKVALRKHMIVHTGIKPHQCEVCGHKFFTRSNMRLHMKTHDTTDRPFVCPLCPHNSKQFEHLLTHIGNFHGDQYAYYCEICRKPFRRYFQLQVHYKRMHTDEEVKKLGDGTDNLDLALIKMEMQLKEDEDENRQRKENRSKSKGKDTGKVIKEKEKGVRVKKELVNESYDEEIHGDEVESVSDEIAGSVNDIRLNESTGEVEIVTRTVNGQKSVERLVGPGTNARTEQFNDDKMLVDNKIGIAETSGQSNEMGTNVTELASNENVTEDMNINNASNGSETGVALEPNGRDEQGQDGDIQEPETSWAQSDNVHLLLNTKKVNTLGIYGEYRLPLATRGFQFNYEKNGKKPMSWFMDVNLMEGKDADKQKLYLRRKGILPPIPRGHPPKGYKKLSKFLKKRQKTFQNQKRKAAFIKDIGLVSAKKNNNRGSRFQGRYTELEDTENVEEEEVKVVKKVKQNCQFENLEGKSLTVKYAGEKLPALLKKGKHSGTKKHTQATKPKTKASKEKNVAKKNKSKECTKCVNGKSKKKKTPTVSAKKGPKLSKEKKKAKANVSTKKANGKVRKPSVLQKNKKKQKDSTSTLDNINVYTQRNSFEALENILSEINSSDTIEIKSEEMSANDHSMSKSASNGKGSKTKSKKKAKVDIEKPKYKYVPVKPAKKRKAVAEISLETPASARKKSKLSKGVTPKPTPKPKKKNPKSAKISKSKTGPKKQNGKNKKLKVKFGAKSRALKQECNIFSQENIYNTGQIELNQNIHQEVQGSQMVMVYPPVNMGNIQPVYLQQVQEPVHDAHEQSVENRDYVINYNGSIVKVRETSVESTIVKVRETSEESTTNIGKVRETSEESSIGGKVCETFEESSSGNGAEASVLQNIRNSETDVQLNGDDVAVKMEPLYQDDFFCFVNVQNG